MVVRWTYERLGDRALAVDPAATAAFWVERWPTWGWCDCLHDRNHFMAADTYPSELRAFLMRVGLLPEWPSETMWFDEEPDRVLYISLYHICGRLLSAEPVGWDVDGFGILVVDEVTGPCPAEFPEPVLEIAVEGWLPWVLAEPNDAARGM